MTNRKKSNTVFYAELDRFGNTYRAIGRTREEAVDALLADYCEQFERWNGADPEQTGCEDEWLDTDTGKWYDRYDEELKEKPYTFADCARDEVSVWEMEYGKVAWN